MYIATLHSGNEKCISAMSFTEAAHIADRLWPENPVMSLRRATADDAKLTVWQLENLGNLKPNIRKL